MRDVFVESDNIFAPLGFTTGENLTALKNNKSGIKLHSNSPISATDFYAALFEDAVFATSKDSRYTKFEQMLVASVSEALANSAVDPSDPKTILIISSTKGNVSLLETEEDSAKNHERIALHSSARLLADHFNMKHSPVVISNACISGILAILTGMRLIQSGQYDHAIVTGADTVSQFVLSGFQSFQAISSLPCRPFDAARDGINLGEGAATLILTTQKNSATEIRIAGGSVSNDANHISGPSRTGEELYIAITRAMKEAAVSSEDINYISAHGTATVYNDEMEARAITLAGLQEVPVNSFKGNYGHTLGAAGIIETILSIHALKQNIVFPTLGFNDPGVPTPVNTSNQFKEANLKNVLKTASGFGGCNAALVISKQ